MWTPICKPHWTIFPQMIQALRFSTFHLYFPMKSRPKRQIRRHRRVCWGAQALRPRHFLLGLSSKFGNHRRKADLRPGQAHLWCPSFRVMVTDYLEFTKEWDGSCESRNLETQLLGILQFVVYGRNKSCSIHEAYKPTCNCWGVLTLCTNHTFLLDIHRSRPPLSFANRCSAEMCLMFFPHLPG